MKTGRVDSLAGAVGIAAAVWASPASAATLIGDYQFQGTRASSEPGPTLTDVGAGPNTFQTESVMGVSRQVLAFPLHSGVSMFPAGLGSSTASYSAVTTFRLQDVGAGANYRRILDPSNGLDDSGFYMYQGMADYYGISGVPEVRSPAPTFTNNVYATVAITSSPPAPSRIYVNGNQVVSADQTLPVAADTLRFFKDNDTPTTDEDSAGAVSCIRVFQGVLSDAEIAAIGASATCQPPPQPQPAASTAPATRRCHKHKKKHHAAAAKKRKCKKRKKR